jgi:hypothetical protein
MKEVAAQREKNRQILYGGCSSKEGDGEYESMREGEKSIPSPPHQRERGVWIYLEQGCGRGCPDQD